MRLVTFITLIAITSGLVLTTITMILPYVYGTTSYLLSGPLIGTTVEWSGIELKRLTPPATLIAIRVADLPEVSGQASNVSIKVVDEEGYAEALKTCRLSSVVIAEIRIVGVLRKGSVSVNGYVAVGSRRKDFHIVMPGLSVAYVIFTNVSCTDMLRVVITGIKASPNASLEGLSLSYTITARSDVVGMNMAYPLIAQDVLVVVALALLDVTYSRCRKYFS